MIIINGIKSELCQSILPNLLKHDKVVGITRSNYTLYKHKNLKIIDSKTILKKKLFVNLNDNKIIFINFAVTKFDDLLINQQNKKIKSMISDNIAQPIYLLKKILPYMIKINFGRIIFFSSSDAYRGIKGSSIYSLSKTALIGLSNSIAVEYSKFNITSNIISLGYFKSNQWDKLGEVNKRDLLKKTLSNSLIKPKSLYNFINLIIREKSVNKSILYLDDGIS